MLVFLLIGYENIQKFFANVEESVASSSFGDGLPIVSFVYLQPAC